MISRRVRNMILIISICLVVIAAVGVVLLIAKNGKKNETDEYDQINFSIKRLVVLTENELTETYNAKNVKSLYGGTYILEYKTEADTKNAYKNFCNNDKIKSVSIDNVAYAQNASLLSITYEWEGANVDSWGTYAMGLNQSQNTAKPTIIDAINNKIQKDNIVVAVIDSGFNMDWIGLTEQNLMGRIDIANAYNVITNQSGESAVEDLSGHGTHVGLTVLDGTTSNVKILPISVVEVKAGEGGGEIIEGGSSGEIIAAIQYAIDKNADVINISLGYISGNDERALQNVINEAKEKNIIVVAAVGNGTNNNLVRTDCQNTYPAACDNVIGVAALKTNLITKINGVADKNSYVIARDKARDVGKTNINANLELSYASYSNYGTKVDFSAPGDNILGTDREAAGGEEYYLLSGTSQAAAHISAAIADIKSFNKNFTNEEVEQILKYYSEDMGDIGRDNDCGEGMPCFKEIKICTCGNELCKGIYCTGCTSEECIYHEHAIKFLTDLEVTKKEEGKIYQEGQVFDKSDIIVKAVYSDGSKTEITNYTYNPTTELTIDNNNILISYTENEITKTVNVSISVKKKTEETDEPQLQETRLKSIEISKLPQKIKYEEGETFDPTGMIIIASYSDGTQKQVNNYNFFPVTALTTENNVITIQYTENGKTTSTKFNITITPKEQTNVDQPANNNGGTTNNNGGTTNNNGGTTNNNGGTTNNNGGTTNNNGQQSGSNINEKTTGGSTSKDTNNNNKTNEPKKDDTSKESDIAYTGIYDEYIIPMIISIVIGGISFIGYRKYKDI